jgi:hypothetical protein
MARRRTATLVLRVARRPQKRPRGYGRVFKDNLVGKANVEAVVRSTLKLVEAAPKTTVSRQHYQ